MNAPLLATKLSPPPACPTLVSRPRLAASLALVLQRPLTLVSALQSPRSILEYLERANLFLVPLDGSRTWYRYHHLFAEVLNRRLERQHPGALPELHRRAARWYEQNGFKAEAIHHALAVGDQEEAAGLVELHGCDLLMRGEVTSLLKWTEAVKQGSAGPLG
jgi:LuxR family maltose regulon positive regulatory protein